MLKEISVCVSDVERHPLALIAACKFAEQHGGRLTAIYIKPDVSSLMKTDDIVSPTVIEKAISEINHHEDKARKCFESLTDTFDMPKVWRSISESLHPIKQMICTDVIFANQIEVEKPEVTPNSMICRLILETKRPVIMIPHGWDNDHFGSKVLLGWNNSSEAMRAIDDALPLMEASTKVTVLDILDGSIQREEYEGLNHIEEYLSRKQIAHQLVIENADKPDKVPEVFSRYSVNDEFDLIVVGAYGRSKAGQIVMGGVTDLLIRESNIPVLFSH